MRQPSQYSYLWALCLSSLVSSQQCFYPAGNPAQFDTPCNTTSEGTVSPCCAPAAMCLANGLCLSGGGLISRGSCTSENFGPPCAQYCKDANPSGGMPISPCPGYASDYVYACDTVQGTSAQCLDNFTISGDNGVVLRPSQAALLDSPVIYPYTELELANDTSTSSTATTPSSIASTSGALSEASCPAQSGSYSAGAVAGAAAGTGVPLLLALLGAVAVILKQRKQMKHVQPMREVQRTKQ